MEEESASTVALRHDVALEDDGALVDAGALVGAVVLAQVVDAAGAVVFLHDDGVAGDADHFAGVLGDDDLARVDGGLELHAGADDGRVGADQRHGLALHVGAHEGAVGVVMLQEGNERGRDADDLLGRDVHEAHLGGLRELEGFAAARGGALVLEFAGGVEGGGGLGDGRLLVLVGGHVDALRGETKGLTRSRGARRPVAVGAEGLPDLLGQVGVDDGVAGGDDRARGGVGDVDVERVADQLVSRAAVTGMSLNTRR